MLPKLSWHDLEGWKCFSHDLNSAGSVYLTVSALLNSILLILKADIDTIYLRSESFKLIIDSKQLADAFFLTSGNCIQTEKILIECTMLKRMKGF